MSKPDSGHNNVHLTFSREHDNHDPEMPGTHVDEYRYQTGSDNRDYEKGHSDITPGYGKDVVDIPVRHK